MVMPDLTMPYGAYKGTPMHKIPSSYLRWVAQNFDDEDICCAADEEYQYREKYGGHFYE